MRVVGVRSLVTVTVLVAGLATAGPAGAARPAVGRAPSPRVYKTAVVTRAGIVLRYPATWTVFPLTAKGLAAMERRVAKKDPDAVLAPAQQATAVRDDKFLAVDLESPGPTFRDNVSALVDDSTSLPSSLADFQSTIASVWTPLGGTVVDTTSGTVRGETFYRADVTHPLTLLNGATVTTRVGQLVVAHGAGTTIVTVSATDDPADVAVIDQILGSVRPR